MKQTTPQSACVTIASRNYLAAVRVLAKSFKNVHPEVDFYVYICDSIEGVDEASEPFKVLCLDDVQIPSPSFFFSHYSTMEANTAVKPFVLEYLLFERGYQKVAYIDPDIEFFSPMTEAWQALDEASIVLTPHIRDPFNDGASPSELAILQSGTYNLGFVAVSRTDIGRRFLRWWQDRLYMDCIVDIPRGIFVDQKWVDLALGYFQKVHIIHDVSYNVAYWNLHDRDLTIKDGRPYVDDNPLVFFHYSGFSPFLPNQLSKHQNRHRLIDFPAVRQIVDGYSEKLLSEGYAKQSRIPYAYHTLSNGLKLSAPVRTALRHALVRGAQIPDPWKEPDLFTAWLMTVDEGTVGRRLAPLQRALLELRPDVASVFPHAYDNPLDPGFLDWMQNSARTEADIGSVLDKFSRPLEGNLVGEIFSRLSASKRYDVFERYADLWFKEESFAEFCEWVGTYGSEEEGFEDRHVHALRLARNGPLRATKIYLSSPELQSSYPDIYADQGLASFRGWLAEHALQFKLTMDEISLFAEFCKLHGDYLARTVALYGSSTRKHLGRPLNAWSLVKNRGAGHGKYDSMLLEWLLSSGDIHDVPSAAQQVCALTSKAKGDPLFRNGVRIAVDESMESGHLRDGSTIPDKLARQFFDLTARASVELSKPLEPTINIAGLFDAATGMGYSARSMLETVKASRFRANTLTLPTPFDVGMMPKHKVPFGWPSCDAKFSITVANADTTDLAEAFVPSTYWSEKNIGYWVWESDRFPLKYAKAAERYDVIWTPSSFSAAAIAAAVDVPVHVLPHVVNAQALSLVEADRRYFGFSEGVTVFGYFFDPKSILERKNPEGALQAFRRAFGDRKDVLFVVKVNGAASSDLEYQRFKGRASSMPNVRLIEETWSHSVVLKMMASLDVYVSLHRAEGFGLTCAEAMAMGKPVIATNYSGNVDFMDGDSACLVRTDLRALDRSYSVYPRGTVWGYPDLDNAAEYMLQLTDSDARQRIGKRAQSKIIADLAVGPVARRLEQLISDM